MATVYNEGPYKNWTAIHFPSDPLKIAAYQISVFGVVDPLIRARLNLNEQYVDGRDFSAFDFDRFMLGNDTGAFIDWSNIPLDDTGITTGNAVLGVGVNPYWTGPYHNPITGALYGFNDRPFIGVLRRDNRAAFYGWPREWHYCPEYDRKYSECVWTEGGAPGATSNAKVNLTFSGTGLSGEEYQQAHENGVTTLSATISALASKVNASSYVSASHVSGGTLRIENTDPEHTFYISQVSWTDAYTGTATLSNYDGVISTARPAFDFDFGGLQSFDLFGGVLDFDLAEAISFASELPT